MTQPLGPIVKSFFLDHLQTQKGLRPASVRSYRDTLRLFLCFVAEDARHKLSRLVLQDLTFERVQHFLSHLEKVRGNHRRTRNQRLCALHTFFEYLAMRIPEMLGVAQRVAAIPHKRAPPPETYFLERDEVADLFASLPSDTRYAQRDRALLLFLYNTGARVQEVADLRMADLELSGSPRVRLHGKGDKWRTCPLWAETTQQLQALLGENPGDPHRPVFVSARGQALGRFGIYKCIRRHTASLCNAQHPRISPHIFRHTTAVHLLEAGVEVNVIRGWLGHVSLDTTHRYAEINLRAKEAALRLCEPPTTSSVASPTEPVWRTDSALLDWLNSL